MTPPNKRAPEQTDSRAQNQHAGASVSRRPPARNPMPADAHVHRWLAAHARQPGRGAVVATVGRVLAAYAAWCQHMGDVPHPPGAVLAVLGRLALTGDGPAVAGIGIWPDAAGRCA